MNWKGTAVGKITYKGKTRYTLELSEEQFLIIMDALSGKLTKKTSELYQGIWRLESLNEIKRSEK